MSAPVVAGAAALLRQYFVGNGPSSYSAFLDSRASDGPTRGESRDCEIYLGCKTGFNISGVALKAALISTTVPISGREDSDGSVELLDAPPDFVQGYGRVQLDQVCTSTTSV